MTTSQRLNSLTRLIILVAAILVMLGIKHSIPLTLIALLVIVAVYYATIPKEGYEDIECKGKAKRGVSPGNHYVKSGKTEYTDRTHRAVCQPTRYTFDRSHPKDSLHQHPYKDSVATTPKGILFGNEPRNRDDYRTVTPGEKWTAATSANKSLAGQAIPRTRLNPIITAPIHSEEWLAPSGASQLVNAPSAHYFEESGYSTGSPPSRQPRKKYLTVKDVSTTKQPIERFEHSKRMGLPVYYGGEGSYERNSRKVLPDGRDIPSTNNEYYTLEPGMYVKSSFDLPVRANIGISETPQHKTRRGYTEIAPDGSVGIVFDRSGYGDRDRGYDGDGISMVRPSAPDPSGMNVDGFEDLLDDVYHNDVYDPRHSYGSEGRAYIDEVTGVVKHHYKDVEAVRQPNYIVRSKIDHINHDNITGSFMELPNDPNYGTAIQQMAMDRYTDSAIKHRAEIMESATRKVRDITRQRRRYPIRTF
jgi:hypothetical protein